MIEDVAWSFFGHILVLEDVLYGELAVIEARVCCRVQGLVQIEHHYWKV